MCVCGSCSCEEGACSHSHLGVTSSGQAVQVSPPQRWHPHLLNLFKDQFSKYFHLTVILRSIQTAWFVLVSPCRVKPLHYISWLIGHEGAGSILSLLRKKCWALALFGGNSETGFDQNTTYSIFSISITLTDEGFQNFHQVNWRTHTHTHTHAKTHKHTHVPMCDDTHTHCAKTHTCPCVMTHTVWM